MEGDVLLSAYTTHALLSSKRTQLSGHEHVDRGIRQDETLAVHRLPSARAWCHLETHVCPFTATIGYYA